MAKVDGQEAKKHHPRSYTDMRLVCSALISVLYGCGSAASNDRVAIGSEQSTIAAQSGQDKAIPVASTSDLPDWMQSALKDPNPDVRLKALEKWIEAKQSGVGPAMLVIDDPDQRVRAKALQLIERAWATEQRAIQNMR